MFQLDLVCFDTPYQFDGEMMLEAVSADGAIVVVVEDTHTRRMLGFIIVHLQGQARDRYVYIVTIDVAPEARRAGVGSKLLQEAEAQAAAEGIHRIGLHVAVDNAAAIAFYERQGYERLGMKKGFYREARTDALIYRKAI
jgi:ribosomal protein S18 acetylase RimI-like enzyme